MQRIQVQPMWRLPWIYNSSTRGSNRAWLKILGGLSQENHAGRHCFSQQEWVAASMEYCQTRLLTRAMMARGFTVCQSYQYSRLPRCQFQLPCSVSWDWAETAWPQAPTVAYCIKIDNHPKFRSLDKMRDSNRLSQGFKGHLPDVLKQGTCISLGNVNPYEGSSVPRHSSMRPKT